MDSVEMIDDNLMPITPIVTDGVCFICQNSISEEAGTSEVTNQVVLRKSLQKYLNVQVSGGCICQSCREELEIVKEKLDDLRDGILVDKDESQSNTRLKKCLSSPGSGGPKKDSCVLTWSDSTERGPQSLYALQRGGVLCDVRLVDEEGLEVAAHACVLAAGSPVLKSIVLLQQSDSARKKGEGLTVKVSGISQRDWSIIMEYLYLGRISVVLNSALVQRVHSAARKLKINSLVTLIGNKAGSLRLKVDLSSAVSQGQMKSGPVARQNTAQVKRIAGRYPKEIKNIKGKSCKVTTLGPRKVKGAQKFSFWKKKRLEPADAWPVVTEARLKQVKEEDPWQGDYGQAPGESHNQLTVLKQEPSDSSLTCKFCSSLFEQKMQLVEHVSRLCVKLKRTSRISEFLFDEPSEGKNPTPEFEVRLISLECFNEDCGATFSHQKIYMDHLRECVMSEDPKSYQQHFKVVEDKLVYGSDEEVVGDEEKTPSHPYANKVKDLKSQSKTIYQCSICTFKAHLCKMMFHLNSVHIKGKPFACKKCPSKFGYLDSLRAHYVSCHTSQTFVCPEEDCKREFRGKSSLKKHILHFHEGKPGGKSEARLQHLCKGCGKMFKQAAHARRHELYHRKEDRTHICSTCNKKFATKQDLQRHIPIHTGFKPHKCSLCSYSSVRKTNITLHERRRHGVERGKYPCHICGKSFLAEPNLKAHMHRHDNHAPSVPSTTEHVPVTDKTSEPSQLPETPRLPEITMPLQSAEGYQAMQDDFIGQELADLENAYVQNQARDNLLHSLALTQPYGYSTGPQYYN